MTTTTPYHMRRLFVTIIKQKNNIDTACIISRRFQSSSSSTSSSIISSSSSIEQQQQSSPASSLPSSTSSSSTTTTTSTTSLYSEEFWQAPNVIDVTPLAESLRETVRQYTKNHKLRLVGIMGTMVPPMTTTSTTTTTTTSTTNQFRQDAEIYSERIQETCQLDGIHYDVWRCCHNHQHHQQQQQSSSSSSSLDIQTKIEMANHDDSVHGILIFYPIFPNDFKGPYKNKTTGVYYKTIDDYIRDLVSPTKDVEGLCGTNWYRSHYNTNHNTNKNKNGGDFGHDESLQKQPSSSSSSSPSMVYPCTAMSVQHILDHYHSRGDWKNQVVSIINRSEIVGRPLAVMLAELGATVYSIDVNSILKFQPNYKYSNQQQQNQQQQQQQSFPTSASVTNTSTTSTSTSSTFANFSSSKYHSTLEQCLEESSIVVTGVPHAQFQVPIKHLQEGTTLVNVSEFSNVSEQEILARPDIHFIPQVGKVTVAMLEQNLMRLHQLRDVRL